MIIRGAVCLSLAADDDRRDNLRWTDIDEISPREAMPHYSSALGCTCIASTTRWKPIYNLGFSCPDFAVSHQIGTICASYAAAVVDAGFSTNRPTEESGKLRRVRLFSAALAAAACDL